MHQRPLDRFHQLHGAVLSQLNRARPHLNGRDPEAWAVLATFRTDLSAALHDLQVYKHREIFGPVTSGRGPNHMIATRLKVECVQLGYDYEAYRRKWDAVDIQARWPEYRLAALSMMRHLREGLARQDDAIRALFDQKR